MLKKIILIILLIVFGVFVYFGYPIIKNRYFKSEDTTQNENKTILSDQEMDSDSEKSASDNIENEENSALNDEIKSEADESGDTSNITAEDCDNECSDFKNNENNLKYCQDICDLSSTKDSDNCDSKMGTDKDYCFKNQAISKTDLKICNSISDTKIKDSCKNRVTEDLLEQQ